MISTEKGKNLKNNIIKAKNNLDLLGFIGGPPCPDFSIGGNNKGIKGENGKLIPNEKEFVILQSMFHLRKSGLGYRKISDEIKKKFGRRIHFPQVHKILNRPHNKQLLEVA